jgi:hypothetical protein
MDLHGNIRHKELAVIFLLFILDIFIYSYNLYDYEFNLSNLVLKYIKNINFL